MLQIPQSVYGQLRRHGEAAYPQESCGVLIGSVSGSTKFASEAIPVQNASSANTRSHYEISPIDLIQIEKAARLSGLEILAFYHSHPDHPAHWSPTDLAQAHWLGYSWVITEVRQGKAGATRSFLLAGVSEEDKHFTEELLLVEGKIRS